jgi:hypothetical protein
LKPSFPEILNYSVVSKQSLFLASSPMQI